MKIKSIILLASLTASPFQTFAASCDNSFNNGGFEDGMECWSGVAETFGFRETTSYYVDGKKTYKPTEGSQFLDIWGNEDIAQGIAWSIGDQLSFDFAITEGASSSSLDSELNFGFLYTDSDIPFDHLFFTLTNPDSDFHTYTHTFTQLGPLDGKLFFQAIGTPSKSEQFPNSLFTRQDVGHVLIDNVQFQSHFSDIPEPGTLSLMAVTALFGWRINRKTVKTGS